MTYLWFFFLCVFFTSGVHTYLLTSQRQNRQWSISVHAVQNTKAFRLYILGHVLGGAFLVAFAYQYYLVLHDIPLLFVIACLAAVFEYIQAFLPAKGKTNKSHTSAAYIMWLLYTLLGFASLVLLPLGALQRLLSGAILLAYMLVFAHAHKNVAKLYYYQMVMTTMLAVAIFIMIV